MHRVEENPVWAAVYSQEFDAQCLHHEFPAVCKHRYIGEASSQTEG